MISSATRVILRGLRLGRVKTLFAPLGWGLRRAVAPILIVVINGTLVVFPCEGVSRTPAYEPTLVLATDDTARTAPLRDLPPQTEAVPDDSLLTDTIDADTVRRRLQRSEPDPSGLPHGNDRSPSDERDMRSPPSEPSGKPIRPDDDSDRTDPLSAEPPIEDAGPLLNGEADSTDLRAETRSPEGRWAQKMRVVMARHVEVVRAYGSEVGPVGAFAMLFVLAVVGAGGWVYVRRRRSEGGEQGERFASGLGVGLALHPGARSEQQDAALIVRDAGTDGDGPVHLFIVADGMGGMDGGQRASRTAVRAFRDAFQTHLSGVQPGEVLRLALETAHRAVCALDGRAAVPGTTLVAAVVGAAGVEWISSGDSRLYLLREGDLVQLTTDHSLQRDYALAVARGSADDGYAPGSNVITSYLGIGGSMQVDRSVRPLPLEEGDRLLLSTDGLYGQRSDDELAAGLGDGSVPDVAQRLVDRVVRRGRPGQDNLTALVVDVDRRFHASATTSRPPTNPAVRP